MEFLQAMDSSTKCLHGEAYVTMALDLIEHAHNTLEKRSTFFILLMRKYRTKN